MPRAKTPKERAEKTTVSAVEGKDGGIILNVFVPGYQPKEFNISLPNIVGEQLYNKRSPEEVKMAMVAGLRKVFGNKVQ